MIVVACVGYFESLAKLLTSNVSFESVFISLAELLKVVVKIVQERPVGQLGRISLNETSYFVWLLVNIEGRTVDEITPGHLCGVIIFGSAMLRQY